MMTLSLGSTGPDVKLLQNVLNVLGFYSGSIDGLFGRQTQSSVISMQKAFGLTADGIVGPKTWAVLDKYIKGFFNYVIRSGDTLYNIAGRYYTSVGAILTANPGIDPGNLNIGRTIVVPFGYDIVFPDLDYTYEIMDKHIAGLKARYPFLETGTIGSSVMGKNLYYIRLGTGSNFVSYNGSHHANESIGSLLLMTFIEQFSKVYSASGSIKGYNISAIFNRSSIYVIPMVNPDGVDLVNYWPNYTDPAYDQAALLNNTGIDLPYVWKANIKGTDLNLNYPAEWDREKQLEIELGITGPAPSNFCGPAPLSEPETLSMYNFTSKLDFNLVIAYHTQGQIIYYQFMNLATPEAVKIAGVFSDVSGYTLADNPGEASYAGYKDWFIQDFRKPGYTFEVGLGVNPIPSSQLPDIYDQNIEALLLGALVT